MLCADWCLYCLLCLRSQSKDAGIRTLVMLDEQGGKPAPRSLPPSGDVRPLSSSLPRPLLRLLLRRVSESLSSGGSNILWSAWRRPEARGDILKRVATSWSVCSPSLSSSSTARTSSFALPSTARYLPLPPSPSPSPSRSRADSHVHVVQPIPPFRLQSHFTLHDRRSSARNSVPAAHGSMSHDYYLLECRQNAQRPVATAAVNHRAACFRNTSRRNRTRASARLSMSGRGRAIDAGTPPRRIRLARISSTVGERVVTAILNCDMLHRTPTAVTKHISLEVLSTSRSLLIQRSSRVGKRAGAKEIGHNLVSRERPKFGHSLVRERHIIGDSLESANDKNSVAIQHVNETN